MGGVRELTRTLYGLLELRPGEYMTTDGRHRVRRDPSSGRVRGGYGFNVWRVYERGETQGRARWRLLTIDGRREWRTVRSAAADLRRARVVTRS